MSGYPVNLLLQNRQCLVVGGGPVALRKASRLLAAGARVKVIAPDAVSGLRELAAGNRIELVCRKCQDDDLDDIFLVFFASNDHFFNKKMLASAQSRSVLSCAVDENWVLGDFITPASCHGLGLQFAIATGGQSCVRSKSVKNMLADQLETLAAEVMLTTFTIDSETLKNESNQVLALSLAQALQLVVGVREFAACFAANHFAIVALISNDKSVFRLLRLILVDAVGGVEEKFSERSGETAFSYLYREFSQVKAARSLFVNESSVFRIGSGLKKLNTLLMQPETLKVDPGRKWQEYADYCRKL